MRVEVQHTLDGLISQFARASNAKPRMAPVVKRHTKMGEAAAKRIAKAEAGPHGASYHKRISHDMRSPLVGEYGPSAPQGSGYTGVNYSGGGPGLDLEKSQDIVGPKYRAAVRKELGRLWL